MTTRASECLREAGDQPRSLSFDHAYCHSRMATELVNQGGAQFAARERRVPPDRDAACCAKAGHCGDGDGGIDFLQNPANGSDEFGPCAGQNMLRHCVVRRSRRRPHLPAIGRDGRLRTGGPQAQWRPFGSCDGPQQELHGEEIEDQS
jgi:hypothetical protein